MVRRFWQDSVRFEFDDGTTRMFHPGCDTMWGPYAFETDNYTYHGEPNHRTEIRWAQLIYTLGAEDYEACLSR